MKTTKTINTTCDICGGTNNSLEGILEIRWRTVDYINNPCASRKVMFGLCNRCLDNIRTAINTETENIRKLK